MLQPKKMSMKRGSLLAKEPRAGRKVFATIDFAVGVSVVFSDCCPTTVSDSETVFLCPPSAVAAAGQPGSPSGFPPWAAAAGLAPTRFHSFSSFILPYWYGT
jgi:hypothetical protein